MTFKRHIPVIVALLAMAVLSLVALASFPVVTNSVTIDATVQPSSGWSDFEWQMNGNTDYTLSWTVTGLGSLTGYTAQFKMSKVVDNDKTDYIDTTNLTVLASNITVSVIYSNVPPDDSYLAELLLTDGISSFRSIGRGTIRTVDSLFDDDDVPYSGE